MGLSSTTNRASFACDGSSTVFSFPYMFFNNADLLVYLFDTTTSIVYPQALNTNYTISGTVANGIYPGGGNVLMNSAAPTGLQLIVTRSPSPVDNFVLIQNQQINSISLVGQLDYLTALVQRLQDEVGRAIALPDGGGQIGGSSFTMSLPSTIYLASSAYQAVVVNSSATGWALQVIPGIGSPLPVSQGGTGQASALIPGGVLYGATPTQVGVGTAGISGQPLLSGGAGAPSFGPLTLSNSSAVSGTLPIGFGGTASAGPYPVGGPVFASGIGTAQQFAGVTPGITGLPLISQGSSAPSFQAISLTGSAVVGILTASSGGTGAGLSFTPFGVFVGSSATQMSQTSAGGGDIPLVGNAGAQPTFRALNLASGSSITGILPIGFGGTGSNLPAMTPFSIIYASGASQFAALAPGAAGQTLTTQGSSALPTWTSSLTNPFTTFGDTLYAGSAAAVSRLAGVITNSTGFYTQVGSGGFSASPVWKSSGAPAFTAVTAIGSSTYSTPNGTLYLKIRMVGAGGGGQGGGTGGGTGGNGGDAIFGSSVLPQALIALGGGAGGISLVGGLASGGNINIKGGNAGQGAIATSATTTVGGPGGNSMLGAGGMNNGTNATGQISSGFGGGGGGGGDSLTTGLSQGGAAGGYVEMFIPNPAASYPTSVGAPGGGGGGGTSGQNAAVGGSSCIFIEAHFS